MSTTTKIIASVILFGITYIAGIVPLFIKKILYRKLSDYRQVYQYVALLNCFAGGVFLATSLLHLLTESFEQMDNIFPDLHYPLCGLIVGVGCFSILFLEHAIGYCRNSHSSAKYAVSQAPPNVTTEKANIKGAHTNASFNHSNTSNYKSIGNTSFSRTKPEKGNTEISATENGTNIATANVESVPNENNGRQITTVSVKSEKFHGEVTITLRILILTVAISIHMIFEGLTIGLQKNDSETWTLFGALSLHKAIIAFSLGVKFCEYFEPKRVLLQLLGFSLMTPIGVAIGISVSEMDENSRDMVTGILQSFATGIFIYITFFEILCKELVQNYSLLRVSLGFLGYCTVAAMSFLHED